MTDRLHLSCAEVDDLAALYVLDALGAAEALEIAGHLYHHGDRHPAFPGLAGVTPFLAESIEPIAPPAELRDRVMGRIAATPQLARPAAPAARSAPAALPPALALPPGQVAQGPQVAPSQPTVEAPVSIDAARERRGRRNPVWGVLAAAAVVAIVVLGGWNVMLRQQGSDAERQLALLSEAVAAAGQPGATLVPMTGTESAAGASGYAVFPADGTGYIVLTGLPPAPTAHTWQAWTIADGPPASAGLMTASSDGLAVLDGVEQVPGTQVVALTIEPTGGSTAPTTTPVVVGQLDAPLAWAGGLVALLP